jgi:RHS repeat-associated protein
MIPAADGGVVQLQVAATVGSNGGVLVLNPTNYKAPKNGYVYIYLSNQSNNDVYWNNFQVGITQGNIAEENHYYAYGLKIATLSSRKFYDTPLGDGGKNNYLYSGKELFDDADLNWYDYGFRNYDPQIGRFIQQDPYSQFPSSYTGMGNDPVNTVDPSGGWAATGIFAGLSKAGIIGVTTLAGAIIGTGVDLMTGGDGGKGFLIGAGIGLGSNFASDIVGQLGNLGTKLPSVAGNILNVLNRPTTAAPNPSNPNAAPNSLVRVYVKHGKSKADGGDNSWDKWDGHTLLQVDNMIYHFYPSKMRGTRNLDPNGLNENGNFDPKIDMKETWNSNGEVGSMDINDQGTKDYFSDRQSLNYGFSVFEASITPTQKTALLQNINNSIANPPDYKTLGTRCQSWCSRMLRSSNILSNSMRQYSWSTVPFSKGLFKLPKFQLIFKTVSKKAP